MCIRVRFLPWLDDNTPEAGFVGPAFDPLDEAGVARPQFPRLLISSLKATRESGVEEAQSASILIHGFLAAFKADIAGITPTDRLALAANRAELAYVIVPGVRLKKRHPGHLLFCHLLPILFAGKLPEFFEVTRAGELRVTAMAAD